MIFKGENIARVSILGELKSTHSFFRCKPRCFGCENGECLEPMLCQCNAGYDWSSQAVGCVPRCSLGCGENSVCSSPEVCSCISGYKRLPVHNLCVPICNNDCKNGQCIAPHTCQCDEGYRSTNGTESQCEPICETPCENGKCVAPNVCECHENFKVHDENAPHLCHCGQYCVELNNTCHCLNETKLVRDRNVFYGDANNCTSETCVNGYCSSPTNCECIEGFEMNENKICVSFNETCVDDECSVTEASEIAEMKCSCINGICLHDKQCHCVNGYKMAQNSAKADICIPHCADECVSQNDSATNCLSNLNLIHCCFFPVR